MATAKYLKETLERISHIRKELDLIESEDNRKRMRSIHSSGNEYAAMFGELSGVVMIADSDIASALRQVEAVERLERIASVFEILDIDLSEDSLKALELLANERRYRHEQSSVSSAITSAIAEIQEQERERERDGAVNVITEAGFAYADDDSGECWRRGNECIQIEMKYQNNVTTYIWSVDRDGVPVDSGKSGEFSRLLAAVSPVVQETV